MKKNVFAFALALFAMAMTAHESGIKVKFQGAQPAITDFVDAYVAVIDRDNADEECVNESLGAFSYAWSRYRKGLPQEEGTTLTVDKKNGFVRMVWKYEEHELRVEMCYWNEADGKHKLFACSVAYFENGRYSPGQFDGIEFLRYTNSTRMLTACDDPGFTSQYGTEDGAYVCYNLPQTGKDITVQYWYPNRTVKKTLKWNGRKFSF